MVFVTHFSFVLRLQNLVIRQETNKLVTDLVNLDHVRSLLKTISYRRRFVAYLTKKRSEKYEQGAIYRHLSMILS